MVSTWRIPGWRPNVQLSELEYYKLSLSPFPIPTFRCAPSGVYFYARRSAALWGSRTANIKPPKEAYALVGPRLGGGEKCPRHMIAPPTGGRGTPKSVSVTGEGMALFPYNGHIGMVRPPRILTFLFVTWVSNYSTSKREFFRHFSNFTLAS